MKVDIEQIPEILKNVNFHEYAFLKYAALDALGYDIHKVGMMGHQHDYQIYYECTNPEGVACGYTPNPLSEITDIIERFGMNIEKTANGWVVEYKKQPYSRYHDGYAHHKDLRIAVLLAVIKCNIGERYYEFPYEFTRLFDWFDNRYCRCAICNVRFADKKSGQGIVDKS